MTETNPTGSIISDHPVELAIAAAVGAVVAAVVVVSLSGSFSMLSDEPPIRVRNGSVELELLAGGEWDTIGGDRKNWKIKGEPDKGSNDYEVVVYGASASTCPNTSLTGNPVTLTVMEGTTVAGTIEVRAAGNKTKVRSDKDLTQSADELISHTGAERFVSEVTVGGTSVCKLTSRNQGLRVSIMDP